MRKMAIIVGVVSWAMVGCGPSTRTYQVVVKNDSAEAVTIWLTKNGPPMEDAWLPPEDIAMMRQLPEGLKVAGVLLAPGKSADRTVNGKFAGGVDAVLRIYRGEKTLDQLLGIGPDSANRQDVKLTPGANTLVINAQGRVKKQ